MNSKTQDNTLKKLDFLSDQEWDDMMKFLSPLIDKYGVPNVETVEISRGYGLAYCDFTFTIRGKNYCVTRFLDGEVEMESHGDLESFTKDMYPEAYERFATMVSK